MVDNVDFFSLPQGADPEKDPVVGRDELGNPRYRSFLGTEYTLETQPVERNFESEPGTMARVKELGSNVIEGAVEGVKSAVTAPRRAMEGEAVTQGDVFGTAGLATTGAAGVTKPAGSLSAGAARTKKKSEINPLFKPKTEDDDGFVTFYSPLRSAIEEMQFSEKGKSGQEIMAYLNKRAPNVSKGELDFSRLDLDPKKRYSKDEVLDNLKFSTEGTIARYIPSKQSDYSKVQIQNLSDQKVDYFELSLESKDVPAPLGTHHTENTLAHSRSTVHRDADGEEYVVINELQSDALQNIGKTDVDMEAIPEPLDLAKDTYIYLRDYADVDVDEDILNFGVTKYQEGIPFSELKKQYKETFGLDVRGSNPVAVSLDALSQTARPGRDFDVYEFEEMVESMYYELEQNEVARSTQKNASTPSSIIPFKTNTEYVKNLLLANIGVAKYRGVNKIVIPPLEEIARLRAKDFEGGLEGAKKTLRPTYVNAVKKAINILNNEYAGKIKVGSRKLKYPDLTEKTKERVVSGQELDISNFDFDPRSEVVRFAEGGQVRSKEDNPILQHHQKNVDEGTYVKNDDGSISTVYTTIMGDGEYEYLIPQVWDGKILSEEEAWERAMSSGIDWPKEPSGEGGVRKLEQLDKLLHKNMSGYAEGGQVKSMEEQMNLFEYGGLADDGMEKEPVTGNEIPPGSMAKEVRDDVPAMLSEGEYVVPADVVRYFGVAYFENLRKKAKTGLEHMEANGRIGGEPVMEEDPDLSPEELQELQMLLSEQQPVQMAEGGSVPGIDFPTFTYTPNQPYGSVGPGMGGTTSQIVQYINPQTGEIRLFQVVDGQPVGTIPEGFVPLTDASQPSAQTPAAQTPATQTPTTPTRNEGDYGGLADGGQGQPSTPSGGKAAVEGPPSYGSGKAASMVGLGIVGGLISGPMGIVGGAKAGKQAQDFNDARNELSKAVLNNDEEAIAKATEAVKSAHDKMNNMARIATNTVGKNKDAVVEDVISKTKSYMDKTVEEITKSVQVTPVEDVQVTVDSQKSTEDETTETPSDTEVPDQIGLMGLEDTMADVEAQDLAATQTEAALDTALANPSLDEGIFGVDSNQPGQLTGGVDVAPAVAQAVANQAAAARGAYTGLDEGIAGIGETSPSSAPSAPAPSAPSIGPTSSAASAMGLGYSALGEYHGAPVDTSVNNAYSGLADSVGAETPSNTPSGNYGGGSNISGAQSAQAMGYSPDPGGEFGGGPGPSGPSGGGQGSTSGGGGSDSGQASGGQGAGAYGGGSSGGDAGTGSDNNNDGFGDMAGIEGGWNKGGMVTKPKKGKATKKRKGLGGRP